MCRKPVRHWIRPDRRGEDCEPCRRCFVAQSEQSYDRRAGARCRGQQLLSARSCEYCLVMLYTRREIGKMALAGLPAGVLLESTLHAATKPNSKWAGVQ